MKHNISRELARSVAEKRKAEEKRIADRKRSEHGALADQAVGNRKSMEVEMRRTSTADRYMPYMQMAVVIFLFSVFIVTAVNVMNKLRLNFARGFSSAEGVVLDPYAVDRTTQNRLKTMEAEIPEIVKKGEAPEIGTLKTRIAPPFKFDIVSISKSKNELCAMVKFVNEESGQVPVIFRWDVDGKFLNLKY